MGQRSTDALDTPEPNVFHVAGEGWYAKSGQGEPIGPFENRSEAEDIVALQQAYRELDRNPAGDA